MRRHGLRTLAIEARNALKIAIRIELQTTHGEFYDVLPTFRWTSEVVRFRE